MSVSRDLLASFVPELLARSIDHRSEPLRTHASASCELAVLGLDISESTSISEDLVKWSPDGSESVARALNSIFTLLADLISEHHGSVITIAGDGNRRGVAGRRDGRNSLRGVLGRAHRDSCSR